MMNSSTPQTGSTARPLPEYQDWDLQTPGNQPLIQRFPQLTEPELRTLSEGRLNVDLLCDPTQLLSHLPANYAPLLDSTGQARVGIGLQVNSTEVAQFDSSGTNLGFPGDRGGPEANGFVTVIAQNNNVSPPRLEQLTVAVWVNPGNPIRPRLQALGINNIVAEVRVRVRDNRDRTRTISGSVFDSQGKIFELEARAPFLAVAARQAPTVPFRPRFLTFGAQGDVTGTLFDMGFQGDLAPFVDGTNGAELEVSLPRRHGHRILRLPRTGTPPVECTVPGTFTMIDGLQIFFQQLLGL
jgi:hypothetical protein